MLLLQKLLEKTGLSLLFTSPVDDEELRQQTLVKINHIISSLGTNIDTDIESEKLGFYPHPENERALNENADSLGYVRYILCDEDGKRLEIPQLNLVSCNCIKMTEAYRLLKSHINNAGYDIELKEIAIDSQGIEAYQDIDEHLDEYMRYFVIHISGW